MGGSTTSKREIDRILSRIYHEAPDDVFELVMSKYSGVKKNRWERGGLNAFRLANKRCKLVVESCTTRLTNEQEADGPDSLPIPIIQRCRRIKEIRCHSPNVRSLVGCPDGLKRLEIGDAPHLSDLSPLASCSRMQHLEIGNASHLSDLSPLASCAMMESLMTNNSSITDISVVSSMPLLKRFACFKGLGQPSIKDLSPLSHCIVLEALWIHGSRELKDLSPLSACRNLEKLGINNCPIINSLAPLSNLKNLNKLYCRGIHPQASVLPLVSCNRLDILICNPYALDLEELRRRRPEILM